VDIEYSLSEILSRTNPRFADGFYVALFEQYPQLERFFGASDMRVQAAALTMALQTLVHWHRHPTPAGEDYLHLLGERHRAKGIEAEDYDKFGIVLLEQLAQFHGEGWTQSLADQWRTAFESSVRGMQQGADTQLLPNHVKFTAEVFERASVRLEELRNLQKVTEQINRGLVLDDVLSYVYDEFKDVIPFNRIGFALIDETTGNAVSNWVKSDQPIHLDSRYEAKLAGSTLATIVETGRPRIINDLCEYLRQKPNSHSTQLIVREGMRSSLTCPLVAEGKPVGFTFFSSTNVGTYEDAHVQLFQNIAGQLSMIVEKAMLYSTLQHQAEIIEAQNKNFSYELEMAKKLQRSMIPRRAFELDGLAIEFVYEPAMQIGGDLLDIVDHADEGVIVFLADSVGHGVQAAMMMAATKTAFHHALRITRNPADVLQQINTQLCDAVQDRFVTGLCVVLDPLHRTMQLASAGHPFLWQLQSRDGSIVQPDSGGLPLGIESSEDYATVEWTLEQGDALVLCTDGVLEASNEGGQQYGIERLTDILRHNGTANANDLLKSIRSDVRRHHGHVPAEDDLTLVVIKTLDSYYG
jgi:serine phosphatase RsbU (regulator of sigma subunit)/hemoglobin-like flavoprotein